MQGMLNDTSAQVQQKSSSSSKQTNKMEVFSSYVPHVIKMPIFISSSRVELFTLKMVNCKRLGSIIQPNGQAKDDILALITASMFFQNI